MKTKKILSLALASVMAVAAAVPAFAADNNTFTLTGSLNEPTVNVALSSTSGSLILNPYKLSYTPAGESTAKNDQIIAPAFFVVSNSETPIKVDVTVTGEIPQSSGATFATTSTAKSTKKDVYLWLDAKAGSYEAATTTTGYHLTSDSDTTITVAEYAALSDESHSQEDYTVDASDSTKYHLNSDSSNAAKDISNTDYNALPATAANLKASYTADTEAGVNYKEPNSWDDAYDSKGTNMVLVKKGATAKAGILTLATATKTDGTEPSVGAFRFFGDATAQPAASVGDWGSADTVNVTVAFTFTAGALTTTTP